MNILITGANGFLGAYVTSALLKRKHKICCCVRNVSQTQRRFPSCRVIYSDFNQDTSVDVWLKRLTTIDVVINCVGILQGNKHQDIDAIHTQTPIALFKACQQVGVKRVIHISALGADKAGETEYSKTKALADEALMQMDIDASVLRPSLLYGTGSYGGTSLFRALSALPGIIPLVGKGDHPFQPVYLPEFANFIAELIESNRPLPKLLLVTGPETVTLKTLLQKLRAWLGLTPAKMIPIPLWLIRFMINVNRFVARSSVNATSLIMLQRKDLVTDNPALTKTGFHFSGFSDVLATVPSQVQDKWHAKLYFLRPVLRVGLAFFWILSGSLPLIFSSTYHAAMQALSHTMNPSLIFYSSCALDIILGVWLLSRWKWGLAAILQCWVLVFYTVAASFYTPHLWLDPFGALIKNIPVLLATLTLIAIKEQR